MIVPIPSHNARDTIQTCTSIEWLKCPFAYSCNNPLDYAIGYHVIGDIFLHNVQSWYKISWKDCTIAKVKLTLPSGRIIHCAPLLMQRQSGRRINVATKHHSILNMINGKGPKSFWWQPVIASPVDHPTKDRIATDSCFSLIGAHQCGILMVNAKCHLSLTVSLWAMQCERFPPRIKYAGLISIKLYDVNLLKQSQLTNYTNNSNIFTVKTVFIPNMRLTAVNKP